LGQYDAKVIGGLTATMKNLLIEYSMILRGRLRSIISAIPNAVLLLVLALQCFDLHAESLFRSVEQVPGTPA